MKHFLCTAFSFAALAGFSTCHPAHYRPHHHVRPHHIPFVWAGNTLNGSSSAWHGHNPHNSGTGSESNEADSADTNTGSASINTGTTSTNTSSTADTTGSAANETVSVVNGTASTGTASSLSGSVPAVGNGSSTNGSESGISAQVSGNSTGRLQLDLTNNLPSDKAHVYVSGLDPSGDLVMLDISGEWYYPTPGNGTTPTQVPDSNVAIPLGPQYSNTTIVMPDYISSARVWFADGQLKFFVVETDGGIGLVEPSALNLEDPSADVNWGFIEFTNTKEGGLFANLSYVDFVGMALGMHLLSANNTQQAKGVPNEGKFTLCDGLKAQAEADGHPWDALCVYDSNDEVIRVVSPAAHSNTNATAFQHYFNDYVSTVAERYAGTTLTIDTQNDNGLVNCTVKGESDAALLECDGDNRPYERPNATDIFGCNSGPFSVQESDNDIHRAVVPRLCAAFNRGTFLLDGGNVQPKLHPDAYYSDNGPKNWYSAVTHKVALDGRGYAFSYDDVTPDWNIDVAGIVQDPAPQLLTVYVGGHTS